MTSLLRHIASKYVKRNFTEKGDYFRYIGEESVLCMHRKKIYVKDVVSITLAHLFFVNSLFYHHPEKSVVYDLLFLVYYV